MAQEKVIKWQFVEDWYKHLILKIGRIDYYLSLNEYDFAFSEMKQIYIQIIGAISTETKKFNGQEKAIELKELQKTIQNNLRIFNMLSIDDNPTKKKLIKQSKLKYTIENDVYELYEMLMIIMDNLNMMFPREQGHYESVYDRTMKKYAGVKKQDGN